MESEEEKLRNLEIHETLYSNGYIITKVLGGWIYKVEYFDKEGFITSGDIIFVPDLIF